MYKVLAIVRIVYQDRAKSLKHFVEVKEWHLESKCLISPFFPFLLHLLQESTSTVYSILTLLLLIRIKYSKYYNSILVIVVFYLVHYSSVSDRNKGNIVILLHFCKLAKQKGSIYECLFKVRHYTYLLSYQNCKKTTFMRYQKKLSCLCKYFWHFPAI